MADLPPRAPPPRTDSRDSLLCSEASDPPEPKWWLLEWMNYLIMAIFLGSVCYHVQQTTFAPKLQRDATSLLPMLTIWSCCMAYFFGFFGISFVDKDEDLLMEFEHTPWEPTNVEELPRTLGSIVEDTGAMTHTPSQTTPRALSTNEEEPVQDALRNADDAERVAAVLARSRSLKVDVVGPISVDGRETLVPLADYSDIARLVGRGARVLRLAGGCITAAGKIREVEIGVCVACPTLATAQSLTDAALARAALARKAPGADPVAIVDATRIGRCCYARVACADAARAVDAVRRLNLPKNARVAAVSPPSSQTSQIACEATVPGPLLKRLLGASVADLCAASARRGAGAGAAPVWRADGRARAVLDAVARATGGPAFEGAVACAVEPANRGRDAHCSLHVEGVAAGGGGAFAALLDLRGAALDGARVRAAACLAAELAGLADDVACSSSSGS
ncbi:unnamed protein product [Pelagomonas calceolata]|uniref:Uncharacterized protein n=2 Tax=Pelagomonas calceolata TaxID=35677 RepID=A0A8J2S8I6_9STRA|nr:unnamed protein product [Pelagomonas calceolata]